MAIPFNILILGILMFSGLLYCPQSGYSQVDIAFGDSYHDIANNNAFYRLKSHLENIYLRPQK
jgi:hypothetical protein